jgi:NAD(P)H dehydrogenase (quinone)
LPKVLVLFDSRSGNTEAMAELVAQGAREVSGVEVDLRRVDVMKPSDLTQYDGIILGSPTYEDLMTWKVKKILDEVVDQKVSLENKIGGGFASTAQHGADQTVISMLTYMVICKMIVTGPEFKEGRLGAVAFGEPKTEDEKQMCRGLGIKISKLVVETMNLR